MYQKPSRKVTVTILARLDVHRFAKMCPVSLLNVTFAHFQVIKINVEYTRVALDTLKPGQSHNGRLKRIVLHALLRIFCTVSCTPVESVRCHREQCSVP